jgi:lipoate-protein ligase B
MDNYSGIIPCGIVGKGVTSIHLMKPRITLEDVKPILIRNFRKIFGYTGKQPTTEN